jgi:DTW domain-containing protein
VIDDPRRCRRCLLPGPGCVCALIPEVRTRTRILIIRHVLERWKPSNTARLAALALPACSIVDHGGAERALTGIDDDDASAWLLYPGAAPSRPPGAPRTLVVLDGSWPQTRRMAQRLAALRGLPRLSLPPPSAGLDRLRRPPLAAGMATIEALARALELLEGPEVARPLDALFAEVVRRSRAQGRQGVLKAPP